LIIGISSIPSGIGFALSAVVFVYLMRGVEHVERVRSEAVFGLGSIGRNAARDCTGTSARVYHEAHYHVIGRSDSAEITAQATPNWPDLHELLSWKGHKVRIQMSQFPGRPLNVGLVHETSITNPTSHESS